eukprot:gnl/MRDRNA2_/MRDRNA2_94450_c0_seq1.p1 gnl/MRDRNA2_/MRDRNA2_94450_c0~~gnl/MRDRNA2_/MRDRNA2_94450_c0_seq1.p1  ORF type:complete len:357 (-),score=61.14 gnl/MRDRNA2_/MRDRNA2_94450_c0_seq1:373-1443(-)
MARRTYPESVCTLESPSQINTASARPAFVHLNCISEVQAYEPASINAGSFYEEYHGHQVKHLQVLHSEMAGQSPRPQFIFLAGDSSLDNKHWFFDNRVWKEKKEQMFEESFTDHAINGYEDVLTPPRMVKDVSYWLNDLACKNFGQRKVVTMNASVEESTLEDRRHDLLPQDKFIRDHITNNDFLVLSIGGNDIALRPSHWTIANMFMLTRSPQFLVGIDWAPGMKYFEDMFHNGIEELVKRMVPGSCKPKKVLVCVLYFLDEQPGGSWADFVLSKLGYDKDPKKLQTVISNLFDRLSKRGFNVPGTIVEVFPLFKVLDGKDSNDYVQRVEPSVSGGRKMAAALLQNLFPGDSCPP